MRDSRRRHRSGPLPGPLLFALVLALFLAVTALRFSYHEMGDGMAFLYTVPIAFSAIGWGLRGGILAAAVASALFLAWAVSEGTEVLYPADLSVRLIVFALLGVGLGYYRQAYRDVDEQARSFYDLSSELLCAVTPEGQATHLNAAWQELGIDGREVSLSDLVHADDRVRLRKHLREAHESQARVRFETRIFAGGQEREVEWTGGADGRGLIHLAGRDITSQSRTRRRMRLLLVEIELTREVERQRIAGELHDFALQQLAVALYQLERAVELEEEGASPHEAITTADRILRKAVKSLRRIMKGFQPVDLTGVPIERALRGLGSEIERAYDRRVQVNYVSDPEDVAVDDSSKLLVFRLVSEAARNAAKHADSSTIDITVLVGDDYVSATVVDDGKGFDDPLRLRNTPVGSKGMGLNLMLEQVMTRGGSYGIDSAPGRGTTITFSVPIATSPHPASVAAPG